MIWHDEGYWAIRLRVTQRNSLQLNSENGRSNTQYTRIRHMPKRT